MNPLWAAYDVLDEPVAIVDRASGAIVYANPAWVAEETASEKGRSWLERVPDVPASILDRALDRRGRYRFSSQLRQREYTCTLLDPARFLVQARRPTAEVEAHRILMGHGRLLEEHQQMLVGELSRERASNQVEMTRLREVFSRYLSPHRLESLLDCDFDVRAVHRATATVLFADIRDFTRLSETLEPEVVVHLLNRYFTAMVEVVYAFDGMLDKYLGDGMMVVFGVPRPVEDHAWQAIQAAHHVREALVNLNMDLVKEGLEPLRFGVGIHSGECVVGHIGAPSRLDFTVIGDTVNTASRIEGLTKKYGVEIFMSDATHQLVRDRVVATSVRAENLRGKRQLLDLYTLEDIIDPETTRS